MAEEQSGDRSFAAWASHKEVRRIFEEMQDEVIRHQRGGYLGLPDDVTHVEARILATDIRRLWRCAGGAPIAKEVASALAALNRPAGEEIDTHWSGHGWILRGRDGGYAPEDAIKRGRHHPIVQALTMSAQAWSDPARALLYTGLQHALHETFRHTFDRREPKITEKFISKIEQTFDGRILRPLRNSAIEVPGKQKLDFGTASMQDDSDLLGADLALALGIRIRGRDMYRVVLLQAKNALEGGGYDVSTKPPRSRQIDKVLSSGMGWYLFYPPVNRGRPFLATVRPAAEIFREVFEDGANPQYRAAFDGGMRDRVPWELGTFVTIAMASQDMLPGRLFPNVEAAADALSAERGGAFAKHVFVADLTGALDAHVLIGKLEEHGYRKTVISSDPHEDDGPVTDAGHTP